MDDAERDRAIELLLAQSLANKVMFLELAFEFAALNQGSEEWVRRFIRRLHLRLDLAEAKMAVGDYPGLEVARREVDALGGQLTTMLRDIRDR